MSNDKQAQAVEPEDDLTIAYMCGVEKGKDYMREAIAKKDAALQACVDLLKMLPWNEGYADAIEEVIQQSEGAMK